MTEVTACGICGGTDLSVLLDMGAQPLAERLGDDRRYPLVLLQCGDCTLVQLSHIVGQAAVFPLGHPYATGNTRALREHFTALAGQLSEPLAAGSLVIDIGANDGTLINAYRSWRDDLRRVAVEPTDQSWKCHADATYQDFFTGLLAETILAEQGPASVVTACNVLAHVPDPHDFVNGVQALLAGDGVFVTENHDVASVLGGLQIDTVYHEHLRYYSITSLSRLLAIYGLHVTKTELIGTHGGSFRVYARKQPGGLQARAEGVMARLRVMLEMAAQAGARVYGVGAATRATPLIHYTQIAQYIECVCEVSSSAKIGHLMPGTSIPIVDEVRLVEDQPEYALLFSWHIAGDLMPKLRAMGYQGRFIIPLPEPRVADG